MVGTLRARMVARTALALLAVAAVALAGCSTQGSSNDSTDKFQGEQRLVANTVEDLQSAATKGDGDQDKICRDLLAQELAREIASHGRTCQAAVEEALKDSDTFELEVQSVRVTGSTATARVKAEHGERDEIVTLGLTKQGTGWRVSDLGA
jgi:hypothetical protein